MMRVITTSYAADMESALRLNEQLLFNVEEIVHYIFVRPGDRHLFEKHSLGRFILLEESPGDIGGAGRQGSMSRWHVHQQMLGFVTGGDTVLNIDSDVMFVNDRMIDDLYCEPGETLGFSGDVPGFELKKENWKHLTLANGESFFHMSGMIHGASGEVYLRAMSHPQSFVWDTCQRLLDCGYECADDVVASYFYQCKGGGNKVRHLQYYYKRYINSGLPKRYEGIDADVIC